jgi:hypothetical protein
VDGTRCCVFEGVADNKDGMFEQQQMHTRHFVWDRVAERGASMYPAFELRRMTARAAECCAGTIPVAQPAVEFHVQVAFHVHGGFGIFWIFIDHR